MPILFFCADATKDTQVEIELWEYDTIFRGGDDFIMSITGQGSYATEGENPFEWAVPFDLSEVLKKSGESETAAEFYFKLVRLDNKGQTGKSETFKFTSEGSSLSIEGVRSRAYSTGSVIEFDVLSKKLPLRTIDCRLEKVRLNQKFLPSIDVDGIINFDTTEAQGVQKKPVKYVVKPSIKSDNDYFITCKTDDGMKPEKTHILSENLWFAIQQVDIQITILEPKAGAKPRANEILTIKWQTNGQGFLPDDTFNVELFQYADPTAFSLINTVDSLKWSTAAGDVAPPLVSSGEFKLPVPPGLGPVRWWNTALSAITSEYYAKLTLSSNPRVKIKTPRFEITEATRGCVITSPNTTDPLYFGEHHTFKYTCRGYAAQDTGSFNLLYSDDSENPQKLPMDKEKRSLQTGSLDYLMPSTGVTGWSYYVTIEHDKDPAQLSEPFLVRRKGDLCAVSGLSASCTGSPLLATLGHAQELVALRVAWAGPKCTTSAASVTLEADWREGRTGAIATKKTSASLRDGTDLTQKLLGNDCVDCLSVTFRFIDYRNARNELSFDVLLSQPTHSGAPLNLGIVKFVHSEGCAGDPNAVTNAAPMPTPAPDVVINNRATNSLPQQVSIYTTAATALRLTTLTLIGTLVVALL